MKPSRVILLSIAILFSFISNAQLNKTSLSFGGGISTLSASNNPKASIGFGADVMIKRDFSNRIQGFAQTGYNAYNNPGYNVAFVPLLIGLNYKLDGLTPGIGIGYGSSTAGGSTTGGFTISPQIGYTYNKYDFIIYYTNTTTNSYNLEGGNWHVFGGMKVLYKIL
jgi:hypothetical protein